jgi:LysM repeat protein
MYYRGDPQRAGGLVRFRIWTLSALLLLLLVTTLGFACGGGSKKNDDSSTAGAIPTATLPSTLPDPIIISGTPRPPSGQRYVVKDGDSPSSIAAQFDISVDELMSVNGIVDPTGLHAGDELIIPGTDGGNVQTPEPTSVAPTAAPAATSTPEQSDGGGQTYTVQDGDIPETIAARFGITAEELMAANNITDAASLQIGQVLVIPTPSQ